MPTGGNHRTMEVIPENRQHCNVYNYRLPFATPIPIEELFLCGLRIIFSGYYGHFWSDYKSRGHQMARHTTGN